MPRTAQPLGLGQACSTAEGPRVAQLAVFHTGRPWGLSESALGREKDATEVKSLKARVEFQGWPGWLLWPGREQSRVPLPSPWTDRACGEMAYLKNLSL